MPRDSHRTVGKAVGIIFLGRFCYLGPNDGLHFHSILAMCHPCPSQHSVYTCAHIYASCLSSTLCCPESQPWLCGPTVWQEHSGPVELEIERSLDLNYRLYLVRQEHSQKGQCPTCSSLLVVFCSWAMGGGPLESLSVPADCGILLGSQQRQWRASVLDCPALKPVSFIQAGWAVVEEISVLIRVYRNHFTLYNTILCKDEICVGIKITQYLRPSPCNPF